MRAIASRCVRAAGRHCPSMKTLLLVPGEAPRALTWTNRHPNQASAAGVVLFRHSGMVLSGDAFRALRDGGAWIETTHPGWVRRALGLDPGDLGVWALTPSSSPGGRGEPPQGGSGRS